MNVLKNIEYKNQKAVDFFRPGYWWDCDKDKILIEQDYDIVIERVLSQSNELSRDLAVLDKIYTEEIIKYIALEQNGQIFGFEQIEEIAKHYNLDANKFRRYVRIK